MKKIFIAIVLLLSLQVSAQVQKADLLASGLTCAMCSKAVFKALSALPFVEKIEADIQKSTYAIHFKQQADTDFDALSKAVVDAGFSVARLTVKIKLNNVKMSKDAVVQVEGKPMLFMNAGDQTLNGEKTIRLIDKQFVSAKEFKKFSQQSATSYGSGMASGKRLYHVTL